MGEKFRFIDSGWDQEIAAAMTARPTRLRIVCPVIKAQTAKRFLKFGPPQEIQIITRFNLNDFNCGVSDVEALRAFLDAGGQVRGARNLHAKIYLFGDDLAMVTSANLTEAAMRTNY